MGDKDNWRRIGAGVCLVGAPLLVLAGILFQAGLLFGPFEDALDEIRGAADRWWTGTVLLLVGLTLLIGAIIALVQVCRRGGADGFGLIGGSVTMIGLSSVIAIQAIEIMLWLMALPGQDADAMQALAVDIDNSNRMALLFIVSLGYFVGWLVLAYALYRSESVPAWVPATQAVGVLAFAIGVIGGGDALAIIGAVLQLVALGHLGVEALRSKGPWAAEPVRA